MSRFQTLDSEKPSGLTEKQKRYLKMKYAIEPVFAALGLVILSPVFAVIFIAIKLEEGWKAPVFFWQKRVGLHKKTFMLCKFRSMKPDTPHDVPTHLLENPKQYMTKVGYFLRRTSLDELPQFFNILKGEVSFCGPRPALWNQYDLIQLRDKYHVHDIRPGLTGWAQINGRDELGTLQKAKLDGYYLSHVGLKMDLKCIFGTFWAVLKRDGIVEGAAGVKKEGQKDNHRKRLHRKRILILTNHSYMFYRIRRELVEELLKDNQVSIGTPFVGHEDDLKAMGAHCIETEVDRRGRNPKTDWKLIRTYQNLLKRVKPDMVITYSIKPNIYAGLLCSAKKIPYYANVQGLGTAFHKEGLAFLVTLLYKIAFRKVKKVFFENAKNAKEFQIRKIIPASKQVVLPGAGVNLDTYQFSPYPGNDRVRFLYLGRIMKEKGMEELFEAIKHLQSDGERFVLDLVGFYEEEYKVRVEQWEKEGVARFHGFQEDPRPFYAAADCVILPSYHEGMSNVLLEAAAMGRPVIASNIPGCKEAVAGNRSGFLCEPKNADSLYHAMKSFLDLPKEKRRKMGRCAREKMEQEFEKKAVVAKTLKALGLGGTRI